MRRDKIEGLWKHILLGYWIAAAFLFNVISSKYSLFLEKEQLTSAC